ncbi:LysR family transcriptional regulator [Aliishimia ponticola]|uniref:LysR family transcriptional regulator n=1 Tax=Aliishimia ponticola TaxID=2499833 RepID=A0A4S4N9K3_9RHOB|nr:LysR family transcriptional regulator [Aliishimia ponticola]THH35859.1 LysR family transcriptional regulator [Aliishimia ponticola]
MEWRDLPPLAAIRAFAAFADTGNVQAAGAALNVSHAAISQQLRALEDHLGLALLDRSGRAMTLTPEGRALAAATLEGFGKMAGAVAELTGAEADRPLQISTTASFAANWLMPRLGGFRAEYPEIDLVISAAPQRVDPAPGGVDLALRYGDGDWSGVDSELLMGAPIVGVAAPSLFGGAPPEDLTELTEYTWFQELGTHEGSDWLGPRGLRASTGVVTVPGNLAIDGARAGEGIALTARIAVEADLASGGLICLFELRSEAGYYMVTRPGVLRPPLRKLMKWLRAEAGRSKS